MEKTVRQGIVDLKAYDRLFAPEKTCALSLAKGGAAETLSDGEPALCALREEARLREAETGAETLWLALDFLRFELDGKGRKEPLLLVPVRTNGEARILWESACANGPLLALLRDAAGLSIFGLEPLPLSNGRVDRAEVRALVSQAVAGRKGWRVEAGEQLCLLSLEEWFLFALSGERKDDILRHKLTASLKAGALSWQQEGLSPTGEPVLLPYAVNRGMRRALDAAKSGRLLCWNEADGRETGRAIADLLCDAAAGGKTALYLSRKQARLEKMRALLQNAGAAGACWLHRPGAGKEELKEALLFAKEQSKAAKWEETGAAEAIAVFEQHGRKLLRAQSEAERKLALADRPGAGDLRFWQAAEETVRFRGAADGIVLEESAQSYHRDKLTHWRALCRELVEAGRKTGHPSQEDFLPIEQTLLSQGGLLRALSHMEQAQQAARAAEEAVRALCVRLSLPHPVTREEYDRLALLAGAAAKLPELPEAWLHAEDLGALSAKVRELLQHGRRAADLRARLLCSVAEPALAIDAQKLLDRWQNSEKQWVVARQNEQNRILRELLPMMRNGLRLDKKQVAALLRSILAYQTEQALVQQLQTPFGGLLGSFWRDVYTEWIAVEGKCRIAAEIDRTVMEVLRSRPAAAALYGRCVGLSRELPEAFETPYQEFSRQWNALEELLKLGELPLGGEPFLSAAANKLALWQEEKDRLPPWIGWRQTRAQAVEAGLLPVVQAYEGGMAHEALEPAFEKALCRAVSGQMLQQEPQLCFETAERPAWETSLGELLSLEQQTEALSRAALSARLGRRQTIFSKISKRTPAPYSEEALLLRAMQEGLSPDLAAQQMPEVLQRALPCVLTSPEQAARLLLGKKYRFDLLVVDGVEGGAPELLLPLLAAGGGVVLVGRKNEETLWRQARELGLLTLPEQGNAPFEKEGSPFVQAIFALANGRGWDARLGAADEPDVILTAANGQKRLGLLLDGRFLPPEALFDRLTKKEPALRRAGWPLLTLWSGQWLENPDGVLETIAAALEAAPQGVFQKEEGDAAPWAEEAREEFSAPLAPQWPNEPEERKKRESFSEENEELIDGETAGRTAAGRVEEEAPAVSNVLEQDETAEPERLSGVKETPGDGLPQDTAEEDKKDASTPEKLSETADVISQEPASPPASAAIAAERPTGSAAAPASSASSKRQSVLQPLRSFLPAETVPYESAALRQEGLPVEEILLPIYDDRLRQKLAQVVAAEAPVSEEVLLRRVLQSLGVQRAGARLQKRLSELAKTLNAQKTTQGGRVFYWRRDSAPEAYRLLRTPKPGTRRDPAELCPYEMANAAVLALQSEGPLPEEALLRAMARLLGCQRLGAAMANAAREGVQCALLQGRIREQDGQFCLNDQSEKR